MKEEEREGEREEASWQPANRFSSVWFLAKGKLKNLLMQLVRQVQFSCGFSVPIHMYDCLLLIQVL